ncbi:hypothetical protein Tco_0971467 [Tanacetum coccineum]
MHLRKYKRFLRALKDEVGLKLMQGELLQFGCNRLSSFIGHHQAPRSIGMATLSTFHRGAMDTEGALRGGFLRTGRSAGFEQIVDFLKGTYIRNKLKLADENGITEFTNAEIFEGMANLGKRSIKARKKKGLRKAEEMYLKLLKASFRGGDISPSGLQAVGPVVQKKSAEVQQQAQYYTEEDWDLIRARMEASTELRKSVFGSDIDVRLCQSENVELVRKEEGRLENKAESKEE